ncbi:MAG: hypothetical protein ACP5NO_08255 [Thermoplasmata archaeon]
MVQTWKGIKISNDTYERMKKLSGELGLSMDAIIRELISYSDSVTGEKLYLDSAKSFYAFVNHARKAMKEEGWHAVKNDRKGGNG